MTDRYIGKKFEKNLIISSLVCITCISVAFGPFQSYSSFLGSLFSSPHIKKLAVLDSTSTYIQAA